MGACCSSAAGGPSASTPLTILVIGLDNSGKTTLTHTINGEVDPFIVPTVGFSAPIKKRVHDHDVVFYDLGGGSRIRGVWPQYFADVHGVVYVVDGTDSSRLEESKQELHQALLHPMIIGKPVLVLANKADVPSTLSTDEVARGLELDRLTLCRHTLVQCTAKAVGGAPSPLDPRVMLGLQWLIEAIAVDWRALEERRVREQAEHRKAEAEKRKERLARIAAEEEEKVKAKKEAGEKPAASASSASSSQDAGASAVGSHPSSASGSVAADQQPKAPAAAAPQPDVPLCKVCKTSPAVRRSAAAGWDAVCDPCGTRLEEERDRKRQAAAAAAADEPAAAVQQQAPASDATSQERHVTTVPHPPEQARTAAPERPSTPPTLLGAATSASVAATPAGHPRQSSVPVSPSGVAQVDIIESPQRPVREVDTAGGPPPDNVAAADAGAAAAGAAASTPSPPADGGASASSAAAATVAVTSPEMGSVSKAALAAAALGAYGDLDNSHQHHQHDGGGDANHGHPEIRSSEAHSAEPVAQKDQAHGAAAHSSDHHVDEQLGASPTKLNFEDVAVANGTADSGEADAAAERTVTGSGHDSRDEPKPLQHVEGSANG